MISMLNFIQRNVRFTQFVAILILCLNRGESGDCPNCKRCAEFKGKPWCVTCAEGYFWAGRGQCFECDKNCNKCSSSNCVQNCEHNYGKCVLGCKAGYYQHNDIHTRALSCRCRVLNCRDCDSGGCTTCEDGYFLQNGQCEICDVSHCKTCQSQNNCHTCEDGYYLQSPNQCFKYGNWGTWSDYGPCSLTCGNGTKTRTRSCDSPSDGGSICNGNNKQTTGCFEKRKCPVDGHWSEWSGYSECSTTCGYGTRYRHRTCDNPKPSDGGMNCRGNDSQAESCFEKICAGMSAKGSQETNNNIVIIVAAAGGAVLLIVFAVVAVVLSRRRKRRESGNDVDNEHANFPNADNELQNREGRAETETEENTYALPNKFRTKQTKEEKKKEPKQFEAEASVSNEPPPLPAKTNLYLDDSDLEELDPNSTEMNIDKGGVPEDYDTYYNTSTFIRRRMTKEALLMKLADHKIDSFKDEFERLADGLTRDYKEALKPENRPRNRYNLVYPYDVSRVIIDDSKSDYINANFIDGYNHPRAYIACLGPTKSTTDKFEQFWKMIWQEDVEKIVMLTHLMEGSTMKCEQYWPNVNNVEKYGQLTVKNISETTNAEYTVRTFKIKKNQVKRDVIHLHFTAWPDKNVPDDVISLLEFRQKVISVPTKLKGPTAVHCSAGIGRTGTYIALDILIQEGKQEQSVDVFGCVNGIRGQRTKLVQNLPQYMYIHYALVHELTFGDDILLPDQFHLNLSDGQREVLKQQFWTMQQSNPRYLSEEEVAAIKRNIKRQHKNRRDADVPGYRNRVLLRNQRKSGSGGYINAVYIHGCMAGSQYIVAQTPLSNTVVDFMDLVMQENVHSIVSMDPANVPNESIGSILPTDDQDLTIGPYRVRCHKQNIMDGYICRELEITQSDKSNLKRTVFHYQCLIWDTGAQTPSSSSIFVRMIRDIETQSASTNSTALIHCLKAAERSCLYCAVSMLTRKIDREQKVNVINTITRIRARRPMAIPNEDQFYFCHECVASFIGSTGRPIA